MYQSHPFEIQRLIRSFGFRYAFWTLHNVQGLSVSQSLYLLFISV
jgi:hypothetical protein